MSFHSSETPKARLAVQASSTTGRLLFNGGNTHVEQSPSALIALDPGVCMGVAVFLGGTLADAYTVEQDNHYYYLAQQFPMLLKGDVVVCEDFVGGQRLSPEGKITIKLIGMIEYMMRKRTGHPPVYQQPQARRPFIKDGQAKQLLRQLPVQKKWLQHHIDAVAHGLCYYQRHPYQPAKLAHDLCLPQGEETSASRTLTEDTL